MSIWQTSNLYGAYGHLGETIARNATHAGTVVSYVGHGPGQPCAGIPGQGVGEHVLFTLYNFVTARRKPGIPPTGSPSPSAKPLQPTLTTPWATLGPSTCLTYWIPTSTARRKHGSQSELQQRAGGNQTDTIILDTFLLADKMEGVDFTLDYSFVKGAASISSLDYDNPLTGVIPATYNEVAPQAVKPET